MGIVMKKVALLATALALVSGSAFAADLRVKAVKAPPPPAFDPWDIAFGGGITNDYIFRGITQSNHKPSVNVYFEPRYNVTKDFQLYVGLGGASISFPNRAAAEVDAYGGARLTVGQFAFDVGAWGYMYPGGTCQYGAATIRYSPAFRSAPNASRTRWSTATSEEGRQLLRGLWQGELHLQRQLLAGRQRLLYAELPQQRRRRHLCFDRRQGDRAERLVRRQRHRHVRVGRIRPPVAGHVRLVLRHWFHQSGFAGPFPNGINYADYNTWNIGIGFTYKVFTLDFRYSDTNLSKGDCNAFTSDFSARGNITAASGTFDDPDQSDRRGFELVRRGRYRQAVG